MSLVIETDHPCTQLISGRDDVLPWIQVEQPKSSATMREVNSPKVDHVSCACTAREDNTGRDDHFMDGVQHSFLDLGYRRLSRMWCQ